MQRFALGVAALIYAIVSVVHLVRFVKKLDVRIGRTDIPVAASLPAATLSLALALWTARTMAQATCRPHNSDIGACHGGARA